MKMMLSLRSREKMSYARSPRFVCSTTMGTSWFRASSGYRIVELAAEMGLGKIRARGVVRPGTYSNMHRCQVNAVFQQDRVGALAQDLGAGEDEVDRLLAAQPGMDAR